MNNLGGLSKYWGGGFFPDKSFYKHSEISNFIFKKFKLIKLPDNYFGIKYINKKIANELDTKVLISPDSERELLNPGLEIEKLCKNYNLKILNENIVDKISFNSSLSFSIYIGDKEIKSKFLLIGAGVIGSPKILYDSNILINKHITIKDHLLYRIPLINLSKILNIFSFNNKKYNNTNGSISSLKQSYLFNIKKRNLFLGLYKLQTDRIKINRFIKFLIINEYVIFSQIYVGNSLEVMKLKISLDYSNEKKNMEIFKPLSFIEWQKVILFFVQNNLLPIPFKYRTKFGSSYHMYGSLVDHLEDLDIPKSLKDKIHIIDSSVLHEIDAEPTSYKFIKNTLLNVEKFLKVLKVS